MSTPTGIADVDALLRALSRLTAEEWLAIGRAEQSVRTDAPALATAELLAGAIVADQRLAVVHWYAADAIETCAALAVPRGTPAACAMIALAQRAARRVALATIVRYWLSDRDFSLLCAPVRRVLRARPDSPVLRPPRD